MIQVAMVTARRGDKVLKVACVMDDAEANAMQALKAQTTGLFRVQYGEWPEKHTTAVRLVAKF